MGDFYEEKVVKINEAIKGKTIEKFDVYNNGDDFIEFTFTDGTILKFRYDWIYEYDLSTMQ